MKELSATNSPEAMRRFWSKAERSKDECWRWLGATDRDGYGCFSAGGQKMQAHRVSAVFAGLPLASGLFACHRCDNPPCINPAHLFVGTNRDNVDDQVAKGRQSATALGGHTFRQEFTNE